MKKLYLLSCLVVFFITQSACGRKAPPDPPEVWAPKPVQNLDVFARVDGVLLRWEAPEETEKGDALLDLEDYLVYRSEGKDDDAEFEEIAVVAHTERDKKERLRKKSIEQIEYADTQLEVGKAYKYVIVPRNDVGTEGRADVAVSVTFVGQSSIIEKQLR